MMNEENNNAFGQTPVESFQVEHPPPPSHPFALIFHVLFKVAALTTYLFGSYAFHDNPFVIPFIIAVIFLALDFWTTKNVSGRLLVGLRWWNEIREDGSNVWIFESAAADSQTHPVQSKIFWIALIVTPVTWGAFLLSRIIVADWNWVILCALACVLAGANVTGYIKCARDARKKVQDMATSFVIEQAIKKM